MSQPNDLAAQLARLADMRSAGQLTDDEFASAKTKLLNSAPAAGELQFTKPFPPNAALMQRAGNGNGPWYKRKSVLITAGVLVLLAILGSLVGKKDKPVEPADFAAGQSSTTAPARAVEPTATQQLRSAPANVPPVVTAPETTADAPVGFTMPNEIGKVLQAAQDDLQRVSGNPLYYSASTDATGAGRMQIVDRNWKVCTQNVPAGTIVTDQTISFGAVKLDESCG